MKTAGQRRIAIAGGYTAGHILTGIAMLKAYREQRGAEGIFIGCQGGLEEKLVPERGEQLRTIPGAALARGALAMRASAPVALFRGVTAARHILREQGTELVIGTGAFASAGTALAARSLGIPLVLHESNVWPGMANRWLAPFANAMCVGFPETAVHFRGHAVHVTGTPTGVEVPAHEGAPSAPYCVLVLGGSLGSTFLDGRVPELLGKVAEEVRLRVIHRTRTTAPGRLATEYARFGIEAEIQTELAGMTQAYAAADFAIACPGALTLAELAAGRIPCLLVPLGSAAASHQEANARVFAESTGVMWTTERKWNPAALATSITNLLIDPDRFLWIRGKLAEAATPNAAHDVVQVCEDLLAERG